MKKKAVDIEKSPFNKLYFITLECGHKITRKRLNTNFVVFIDCRECDFADVAKYHQQKLRKSSKRV